MFHLISLPGSPRTSPGPGRGTSGAGGGIRSDPTKLQFKVGGIRAGNKSLKKKGSPFFFFSSFYLGSISCTTDSRTLEAPGGVGGG